MKTVVERIPVYDRSEPLIISTKGMLKRKFLLSLLQKGAIKPSYAAVVLLRETINEISANTSRAKFEGFWGETLKKLEEGGAERYKDEAWVVEKLLLAQTELRDLLKIAERLDSPSQNRPE